MEKHNGWTNYPTWRINLEMFDGMDPKEMGWEGMDRAALADCLKEYVTDALDDGPDGLAKDYAMAFVSPVNWWEIAKSMMEAYEMCEVE